MKPQSVRLLDIFLIGPLMIAGAMRSRMPEPWRTMLLVSGALTILYNGANYLDVQKSVK